MLSPEFLDRLYFDFAARPALKANKNESLFVAIFLRICHASNQREQGAMR